MTTLNPEARYDATLRILHWAMAAIILIAIALGVVATFLRPGASPRVELLTIQVARHDGAGAYLPARRLAPFRRRAALFGGARRLELARRSRGARRPLRADDR